MGKSRKLHKIWSKNHVNETKNRKRIQKTVGDELKFSGRRLTEDAIFLLDLMIQNEIKKYNVDYITELRYKFRIKQLLLFRWASFNIERISEEHLPYVYFYELIKRLAINASRKDFGFEYKDQEDELEEKFIIEERQKDRKNKIQKIKIKNGYIK